LDIAVIGAGGSIGREISQLIISERILQCDERLILVANSHGASGKSVFGYAQDLQDAYAEITPKVDVMLNPARIKADLIVMAAGSTLPVRSTGTSESRDTLAEINAPLFHRYAELISGTGRGHEIVLCISNPNELCVAIFAKQLGSRRVIGMGAFLDSLRFRQEIASDLGIRRQQIHGFMVGEHGFGMVPLWSGIHIFGYSEEDLGNAIRHIRKGFTTSSIGEAIREAGDRLKEIVSQNKVRKAYQMIRDYPPDIRVALKPFITHFSGSKTVMGTSRAAMDFIRIITQGSDALIAGQISLQGEFYGIQGAIGVPFVAGNKGVDRVFEIPVSAEEKKILIENAARVQKKLIPYL
jgi:malate dehydrogenase